MRHVAPGSPEPLGLAPVPGGVNVAVYSAHATSIELCLFDAAGASEQERIALPERTGDVFHGFVADVPTGTRYGLRAHGPYEPRHGHRFNPAKLLVDPYARALDRPFLLHPTMFGERPGGAARDDADSAPFMPKAIVTAAPARVDARRPRVPWSRTILYELHVRGFTQRHPRVPEAIRGTCAALAHPAAIEHLLRLGVTTVELMPVAAAIDERHLAAHGLTNYWGYNPAAFFVPDHRLAPGGLAELRACVAALQAAGLEVVLDVVLNHTGEGDAHGPTLSLRGLDNATYYRTAAHAPGGGYRNDTGCGNTLALDRPPVLRLALDALRHYADAAGVDGFRFDLATTLGRDAHGFDAAAPLLAAIMQDPVLRELKLVAEPWDVGRDGYQLGAFPPSWGEWNDRYRDTVRRFWRGDRATRGDAATRVAGSGDIFAPRTRPPSRSVNFVTAHDGLTLADLVAHERKHNEANGEDGRDGTDANFSWNHGVEGATADPAVRAARDRDVRALLATLLFARGTPMLAMGDELGRTQRGNNNAYAHDSALTWVDWENADGALAAFVAGLVAQRNAHPALRRDRWLIGAPIDGSGIPDVEWRHPDGHAMAGEDWARADGHALIATLYAPAEEGADADRVVLVLNADRTDLAVRLPEPRDGFRWRACIDTSRAPVRDDPSPAWVDATIDVATRSVLLLAETRAAAPRRHRRGADPEILARLAVAAGVAPQWWDIAGTRHPVSPDTQRALLEAMELPANTTDEARASLAALADARERRLLPAVIVIGERDRATIPIAVERRAGRPHARLTLRHEDGSASVLTPNLDLLPSRTVAAADGRTVAHRLLTMSLPPEGCHTLAFDDDPAVACRIIVTPGRCHVPAALRDGARRFGLAAHLYALRRPDDQGIGDFTTLGELGAATASVGGVTLAINPLHMLFAADRERASPYHPSDRRFVDPLYVDVARVPDLAASPEARAVLAAGAGTLADLSARDTIDYPGVWRLKHAVLSACFRTFEQRPRSDPLAIEFERFVAAGGETLRNFAVFEAIAVAHPRVRWDRWPSDLRRPDAPGVATFAAARGSEVRFALYLQWQADRQFAEAGRNARAAGLALGFYRDLAVGAAPDGAEVWASPAQFARGVSIGAPPDPFTAAGQIWNLPAPNPHALTRTAYAGFRELVAANMRHAGALRIDHVMGLARLFWIPDGAKAADGAYVSYPLDDLVGVLAQESARARCLVVGEDLGTVPEGFRERLAAADIHSNRVLWLEREGRGFVPMSGYPSKAAACVSTHDLPTIAGWWAGADIAEKRALGLSTEADAANAQAMRREERRALAEALARDGVAGNPPIDPDAPHDIAITAAIHRHAAGAPSALLLVQADDLAGETVMLNLPGTDRERPNWRRRIRVDAGALWKTPIGVQWLADVRDSRAAAPGD